MSRSGWVEADDIDDQWQLIRSRGAVRSAVRGRRGQAFLKGLLAALDAMPQKELIQEALVDDDGRVCTLGCAMAARGVDPASVDYYDPDAVAGALGIARSLAQEIMWENDEQWGHCEPEKLYDRMHDFVLGLIRKET